MKFEGLKLELYKLKSASQVKIKVGAKNLKPQTKDLAKKLSKMWPTS